MCKQLELFPEEEEKEEEQKKEEERVDLNPLFERLYKSKFRSSFYLNAKDKEYIKDKGWDKIEQGTREIIAKRLAPAFILNDGKQTPMRHGIFPPFIAQHATGCCCRNCLQKWHGIPKGRQLTLTEQRYIVRVIMEWLHRHCE